MKKKDEIKKRAKNTDKDRDPARQLHRPIDRLDRNS